MRLVEGYGKSVRRRALKNGILAWLTFGACFLLLSVMLWHVWDIALMGGWGMLESGIIYLMAWVCLMPLGAAPCGFASLKGLALAKGGGLGFSVRLFCIIPAVALGGFVIISHMLLVPMGMVTDFLVAVGVWFTAILIPAAIGYFVGKAELKKIEEGERFILELQE